MFVVSTAVFVLCGAAFIHVALRIPIAESSRIMDDYARSSSTRAFACILLGGATIAFALSSVSWVRDVTRWLGAARLGSYDECLRACIMLAHPWALVFSGLAVDYSTPYWGVSPVRPSPLEVTPTGAINACFGLLLLSAIAWRLQRPPNGASGAPPAA